MSESPRKLFITFASIVTALALVVGVASRASAAEETPCTNTCYTALSACLAGGGSVAVCSGAYDCCMSACGHPNPGYPCKKD